LASFKTVGDSLAWLFIKFVIKKKKMAKPGVRISLKKYLANFHLGPSSYPLCYVVDKPFSILGTLSMHKRNWPH